MNDIFCCNIPYGLALHRHCRQGTLPAGVKTFPSAYTLLSYSHSVWWHTHTIQKRNGRWHVTVGNINLTKTSEQIYIQYIPTIACRAALSSALSWMTTVYCGTRCIHTHTRHFTCLTDKTGLTCHSEYSMIHSSATAATWIWNGFSIFKIKKRLIFTLNPN